MTSEPPRLGPLGADLVAAEQRIKFREHMLARVIPVIRKHGWMVQGVFGTKTDPGPNFAYTIGLTEAGIPELVITGLPHGLATVLLNAYARRHFLVEELHAGDEVTKAPSLVPFRVVDAPGTIGGPATVLYGKHARFLQLVWPDQDGNYPGDPGWTYDGDAQPVFSTPRPDPPTNDGMIPLMGVDYSTGGGDGRG